MKKYSIETRSAKYVKRYRFLSFARNYKKQLLDKELDASKKVFHKADEYLGNKIADALLSKTVATQTKSKDDKLEKQDPVEEITIPPENRKDILNKLRKVL